MECERIADFACNRNGWSQNLPQHLSSVRMRPQQEAER